MCPEPGEEAPAVPAATVAALDPTQVPYEVYSLTDLKLGKEEANPLINPGDIVIVQEAKPVYVTGAVNSPQGLYLREGNLQLMQAIAMVGGLRKEAKGSEMLIYRRDPNSKTPKPISVNFNDIRKQKAEDIALQPYDIIVVPDGSGGIKNTIFDLLKGAGTGGLMTLGQGLPTRVLY